MAPTPALIAACITFVLLSGCTSAVTSPSSSTPAVSASPTQTAPSPTPSPTWSAEQAAAIATVDEYRTSGQKIWADPAAFSEKQMRALLKSSAGPKVVDANVASYLDLKKRGFRYDGATAVLTTTATKASDVGYGTEVIVTRCIDQRALRVLDATGAEVSTAQLGYELPDFNLRQYTVQKRGADKAFRVYGIAPTKGKCGP